ncbi:MAG: hypothetical protein U0892_02255 [Pirellulales bacterium]
MKRNRSWSIKGTEHSFLRANSRFEPSFRAKLFGKGLGIAAFSPSPDEPVHVFIANDTTPCYWLVPKTKDGAFIGWEEQRQRHAYNASKATGSMGSPSGT